MVSTLNRIIIDHKEILIIENSLFDMTSELVIFLESKYSNYDSLRDILYVYDKHTHGTVVYDLSELFPFEIELFKLPS